MPGSKDKFSTPLNFDSIGKGTNILPLYKIFSLLSEILVNKQSHSPFKFR